jgi:hypothetical protein
MEHFSDMDNEFASGYRNAGGSFVSHDNARNMIQELSAELPPLEQTEFQDKLNQLCSKMKEQEKAQKQQYQKERAAEAAERAAKIAERKKQIIDAIVQAPKQPKLSPFALIKCGAPGCPEPGTTIWLSNPPESECMNFDHIVDAFCAQHWRGHGGNGWPLHWHDAEFLHPAVSTVCIAKTTVYKGWTRNPEKFGKRVPTAKDRINNTIKCGTLVTFDRPLGDPRQGAHTETAFGRVEKIWKVGTIRVLQMRRIQFRWEPGTDGLVIAKPTLTMSPRLSTKYAEKVVVLSTIPKMFRKVLK